MSFVEGVFWSTVYLVVMLDAIYHQNFTRLWTPSQNGKTALTYAKQYGKHDVARLIEACFFITLNSSVIADTRCSLIYVIAYASWL